MTDEKIIYGKAEVNEATLDYCIIGPANGPLVITLHGGRGFGSKEGDFEVYSRLAKFGYKVLGFDFRGHGKSSFTPPFTFSQIVDDIDAMRKKFINAGDKKCIIIGGSFGGFIAQKYALTYPENLSHLILRGTAPSYHHEEAAFIELKKRLPNLPIASVNMLEKVFSKFESDEEMRLVMFALGPLYSESYDADAGLRSCLETRYKAASHNQLYSEQEKYFDYRQELPNLKIPTFIFDGEEDWICPKSQSELLHKLIPKSELYIFPNANHSVHREFPDLVVERIRIFLNKKTN